MSSDGPNKTSGQFHSTKGSVKDTIGSIFGATNLQREGKQEHAAGEAEYDAARAKGYAEGTQDRVVGKKDQVVGSITGDRSQQMQGDIRHGKGETQQDINRKL
ncbi:hypothetical protein FA15DRAFT_622491 [Coprinopsis marcescibilis]|uniref:CsbD-like domain-containing protein n=1 Tax=Coprinopsis marcescibilis TaxID=230819 RepID=A0A5C3KRP1_COPMA|nr:hypothetical protein FA15DRAFT_622491 [Coprinopsis marcescibilis]